MSQECGSIASFWSLSELKTLDLSCNPIGFDGLCSLLDAGTSNLQKLENLVLYKCGIYAPQECSMDGEMLELNCLKHLNLSHNNLTNMMQFVCGTSKLLVESLETLILVDVDRGNTLDFHLIKSLSKL